MERTWVVTGGIGSGKSTIRRRLGELGATTIDADAVGHDVLSPGGAAERAVRDRWPSVVVDDRISRPALGAIVFSDPDELRALEAITHPVIADDIRRRIASAGDDAVVVVEVSIPKDLVGVGWLRTIVADLPVGERIRRLVARGMEREDIDRRLAAQPDRDDWRARGRWIVRTAGTHEEVRARVDALWERAGMAG